MSSASSATSTRGAAADAGATTASEVTTTTTVSRNARKCGNPTTVRILSGWGRIPCTGRRRPSPWVLAVKPLLAAIAVAAALVLPTAAGAGIASITFRDVPLNGERTLASTPGRFDLVGVRWHGSGTVKFSVHSTTGRWGAWLDAASEEEDQPDGGHQRPLRRAGGGSATRPGLVRRTGSAIASAAASPTCVRPLCGAPR